MQVILPVRARPQILQIVVFIPRAPGLGTDINIAVSVHIRAHSLMAGFTGYDVLDPLILGRTHAGSGSVLPDIAGVSPRC
jgi:hypothetical protein